MAEDGQIFPETAGFHDIGFVASVGEVDISLAIPKKNQCKYSARVGIALRRSAHAVLRSPFTRKSNST